MKTFLKIFLKNIIWIKSLGEMFYEIWNVYTEKYKYFIRYNIVLTFE